ncbi:MAG: hypothetical protein ACPF9U_07245 [Flavobacteriaceae bacterium]
MTKKAPPVFWTFQAKKALQQILDYRYKDAPKAREIVRMDIITSSKNIVFAEQFQRDDIYPAYRKISVRDYKILYTERKGKVYIMNVVCQKAG